MPRPSLPVLSARAHRPLISFLGKRVWPSCMHTSKSKSPSHSPAAAQPSHPHPAAPPEYRKTFSDETQSAATNASFNDFWDAPPRLWKPKHHEMQAFEIDAVQSGGASLL